MEASVAAGVGAADMVADRVQAEGTELVGDVELLAVVIGGRGALPLAAQLVAETGSLQELARTEAGALPRLAGITRARASRIHAALELGKRSLRPREVRQRIESPAEAAALIRPRLQHATRENFGVILLFYLEDDCPDTAGAWRDLGSSVEGQTDLSRHGNARGAYDIDDLSVPLCSPAVSTCQDIGTGCGRS